MDFNQAEEIILGLARAGVGGISFSAGEPLLYFDERMQEIYKSWARGLLRTTNPYTGVPLADEPADLPGSGIQGRLHQNESGRIESQADAGAPTFAAPHLHGIADDDRLATQMTSQPRIDQPHGPGT